EICEVTVEEDGVVFDPESVKGERIKEDQDYEGVRIKCLARLASARVSLQIDVGFGDAVIPRATQVEFPTILEYPAQLLKAYPREAVVAEKFQAMVMLDIANSRMKDFFDLWVLAREFSFEGSTLSRAIAATFRRRKTALPPQPPLAVTALFGRDSVKIKQWQ